MKQLNKCLSALFLAVMLGSAVAHAEPQKQEAVGEYFDDSVITAKVKAAIFHEPVLQSAEINVETFKGVVQLSGFVSTPDMANMAAAIAYTVPGVKSVRNDMRAK